MAREWDATVTIGCNTVLDEQQILKEFSNAQHLADKNIVKISITGDEKDFRKELEKLQSLDLSATAKIMLDFNNGDLKDSMDFLNKYISNGIRNSGVISKAFSDQIKSGLGNKDAKETLTSVIKSIGGTKNTQNNFNKWAEQLKADISSFNFGKLLSMDSSEAMQSLTDITKRIEQFRRIIETPKKERDSLGITGALEDFRSNTNNRKDYEKEIDNFYGKLGDYISNNIEKLNTDVTAKYEKFRQNVIETLMEFLRGNGDALINKATVGNPDKQAQQLKSELDSANKAIEDAITQSRAELVKFLNKNTDDWSAAGTKNAAQYYATIKDLLGLDDTSKEQILPEITDSQKDNLQALLDTYSDEIKLAGEFLNKVNSLKNTLENAKQAITRNEQNYIDIDELVNARKAVQSGASHGKSTTSIDVEINPVITDPAEFIAKIEAQLANQIVKIAVEPAINSAAEFQELLRQQLPNEFVDVKFNLENGSTLSLDGILAQFDTLKEKIDAVKPELSNLETLSGNSAASIKSIFEHLTIQQPTNSTQFSEILRSIKQLQDNVDKGIDMDKVDRLVQALSKIGELAISPNIDLSKFSLGGINRYLDKTDNIKTLGKTLDVLADGLYSLNISLTDAKFSELKDFTISDEVLKNLPKFAKGLEGLGKKLQTFSSSATGVLSSINQILSQSKSLEYLYNLANSPNSSKQSNIVGNGLLNAFDKSAINTIQHPAGGTDEVAALAKEYQWLTSQAKAYFALASKYAKGTISSGDSLKLTQLERAMAGAIQRMTQFQETDQSLVTAQTDLQNALNKCGTAVESGLVNNLTKALTQIDTAENKALGFSNSIQEVKDKVVEIQRVFSTGGLIPTSEIEKAEGTLKKALSDVKQLKQDISEAKKAQENEIKNSYKNIFGNYGNTALGKADKGVVTDEVEIQKLVNEYNYLNKALSEYIQLMGKEAANPDKSADRTAKIAALTNAYTAFIERANAGVDTESRLAKASGDLSNALSNAGNALSADLSKKLQSYIDKLDHAKDGTTKYSNTIRKLQEVQQRLSALQNTQKSDVKYIKALFDEYQIGADVYSEALAKIKAAQKEVLKSQKAQLSLDIEKWLRDNTKAAAKYETELRQLQKDIQSVSTAEELDEIRTKVLKFEESAEKAKLTGSAFADTLKQKFKELGTYLMSFASFYQVVNILKQGVSIVHDYDDAFTEMRKVTNASTSSLKEFQKESFKIADQVGTTAKDLQQSTADWLRLGESFEEAKKSAQDTTVLLNVSEFEDINSATESLTAMSQAYQELDKMEIIDKLNNIGNNFNIATNDLAESLQRSAATLKVTGNTIDEAIALTVAGNSILQDPLSVGAGLKTISLRIQGTEAAKQELEELGEETENVIHTTAKLQETIKECTAVASNGFKGVDILDNNGNFLSTYEILSKIAEVYQEIVETDRQNQTNRASLLVETLAGKNRANIAAGILQSPELLKQVYEEVKESSGSAQKELNSYLDSISGKLTTLKNTWQELWFNFIDSSTVKGVVDVLNDLAKIVEKLTTFAKPMGTISALIGGMVSVFGHGKHYKLYNASFYKTT